MILERLDLTAFGRFTDFSLDLSAGPNRFHIIYGPNESGKSTSLRAITSLLYGMPARTNDNYVHPNAKMRVGGKLVDDSGRVLECVRRRGRKDTLRGMDETPIAESVLQAMLSGVNQEMFEQRFGLSHQELVRGGAEIVAGGGDLGSILFAAGAGVSQLRAIQDELKNACSALYIPRGKNGSVNQAVQELSDLKRDLREAQVLPSEFDERTEKLKQKQLEVERIRDQLKIETAQQTKLQTLIQAIPLSASYKAVQRQIEVLANVPLLDEHFSQRRRSADTEREIAVRKHAELLKQQIDLENELSALSDACMTIEFASEIDDIYQRLGAREESIRDQQALITRRNHFNRRMVGLLKELNVDVLDGSEPVLDETIDHWIDKVRVGEAVRARIHELARVHEKWIQQLEDAREEREGIQKRIESLESEIEDSEGLADPEPLDQLLDSIGQPDLLLRGVEKSSDDLQRAKRACDQVRRRLVGTKLSAAQLSELTVPSQLVLEDAATEIESSRAERDSLQAKCDDLKSSRDELKRRLSATTLGSQLPTLQDLEEARRKRDKLVTQTGESQPDDAELQELRLAVQQADQLADTIIDNHEQVHRRAHDSAELESIERELQERELQLRGFTRRLDEAQEQWRSIWQNLGVQADTPSRMKQWVADHEQFVISYESVHDHRERLHQAQNLIQGTCHRLRRAIDSTSPAVAVVPGEPVTHSLFEEEDSQIDLQTLYDEAVVIRRKLTDDRDQRSNLQSKLSELRLELPRVEARVQSRLKQVDNWQCEWSDATSSFGDTASPAIVMRMLTQVQTLLERKHERDVLSKRIRSIGEESEAYRAEVDRLADRIAIEFDEGLAAFQVVRELFKLLGRDRAHTAKREKVAQQLSEIRNQLTVASETMTRCDVVFQQLCAEAKCESKDDLAEIERQSRQLVDLKNKLSVLQEKFQLLGAANPVDLIQQAEASDLSELEASLDQSERRTCELSETLAQLQQEVGATRNQLDMIDGGNAAADLTQSIQEKLGDVVRDAESYARLRIASMILDRSIEHYRKENQGPVLGYARELFRRLTCDEYSDLRVEHDSNGRLALFGIVDADSGPGDAVRADVMSTGTADVLYLAMRLATLKHHLKSHSKLPMIVDDCLVQMDDRRASAALSVFAEISQQTQIILFTHHRHLVDLAEQSLSSQQFHVHHLR